MTHPDWPILRAAWEARDERYRMSRVQPSRVGIEAARIWRHREAAHLPEPDRREAWALLDSWDPRP